MGDLPEALPAVVNLLLLLNGDLALNQRAGIGELVDLLVASLLSLSLVGNILVGHAAALDGLHLVGLALAAGPLGLPAEFVVALLGVVFLELGEEGLVA